MTSQSSGYLTVRRNLSDADPIWLKRNVSVPAKNAIMISFKQLEPSAIWVILHRHFNNYNQSQNHFMRKGERIWNRFYDPKSDLAHLLDATHISVSVKREDCMKSACFRLFFSFFPESERPNKLPNGFWNCSVRHYASFHHHLACNLETECEDGQDETGDCPYSSPHCQGLIALCNRCYKIVEILRRFVSDKTDLNARADDYCNSLGSKLSLPRCVHDWGYNTILRRGKVHRKRLMHLLAGLYTDDISLPSMYIHSVISIDSTVFHHTFNCHVPRGLQSRKCLSTPGFGWELTAKYCEPILSIYLSNGAVCEFKENNTETHTFHSNLIPLISTDQLLSTRQQSTTQCRNGHVTHTFLLCGSNRYQICDQQSSFPCQFSDQPSFIHQTLSAGHHDSVIPTFTCNDNFTMLSYSLVCDYIIDCHDESDESFCEHSPCHNMFRCTGGQCLSFDKICDYMFHCQDESDEKNCDRFRFRPEHTQVPLTSPALVYFDGVRFFTSTPMNFTESCSDSHYQCPGDHNDCLPVYTRCNGMYDCIDHQDEDGCEEMKCPGHFRCRLSKVCLHRDFMCDGWSHCPMHDDELSCDITCPLNCLCQGHTFLCPQPFSAALFPQLRYLDATGSGMTLSDVNNNTFLIGVVFAHCSFNHLHDIRLVNLRLLDLSGNKLKLINLTYFVILENLQVLSLSNNPLTSLYTDHSSVIHHRALTVLDLSHTKLKVFDTRVVSLFPHIQKLNLTSTSIHSISLPGFRFTPQLTELYMDGSPVRTFPHDVFKALDSLRFISTQNYKLCCKEILPYNFDNSACIAPKDEISSCEDLLRSWTYRGFLWLIACLSVTGNVFCCCVRFFATSMASSTSFSVFVTNLTLADFLMGVYIAIIGVADERFRGRYLHNDDTWKNSVTCKVAGFLSLLSSEVSALIIWFITLDRFLVLRFPFSTMRFDRTSSLFACLLTWLFGWFLALLPLLPVTSHWEFYGQTGICIPLAVTRRDFKGRFYSFSVLIVLNLIMFSFISAGQAFIYWSIQDNALKTNSTKVSRDMTIARRLIIIAMTDFLCWFPIGLSGMLALAGTPIPGEVNVALSIFILPLNSAINPFMYTFNTLAEKMRKTNESKLLEWLESHHHLVVN